MPDPSSTTVALIQMRCSANKADNVDKALARIADAAGNGAQELVLAEETAQRLALGGEPLLVIVQARVAPGGDAALAALAEFLEENACDVRIRLVVARPARQQVFGGDRSAVPPAGAQLLQGGRSAVAGHSSLFSCSVVWASFHCRGARDGDTVVVDALDGELAIRVQHVEPAAV